MCNERGSVVRDMIGGKLSPPRLARAEASAAIEGQARPDPWKHLLAARGFGLLGDTERASAEFALAEQAAGDDPEVWVVTGWVHARLADHAAAEKAFQRAIDLDPQKASPWIARGRYLAERGTADEAESDFTHAASLTPDELDQFLEAGWWVMGPIPQQQVSTAVAAALAGDPAQTLTVSGAAPGRPATSLSWQPRQPDFWDALTFGADMHQPNHSALAMTVMYSPDERITTLWIGGHDRLRVWLNGQLMHEKTPETLMDNPPVGWPFGLDCVPIVLHRGRNVLLVEATRDTGPEWVHVRLGDSPLQRALQFTRLGLWQQAVPHWEEFRRRGPPEAFSLYLLGCLVVVGWRLGWLRQARAGTPLVGGRKDAGHTSHVCGCALSQSTC